MADSKRAIFRRRLFTILSVLSLLLCLATIILWIRSCWYFDGLERRSYTLDECNALGTQSVDGALYLVSNPGRSRGEYPARWEYDSAKLPLEIGIRLFRQNFGREFVGFGYLSTTGPFPLRSIYFPHWFLALLFAILPALYLRGRLRSHRRVREGCCPVCGYDLRATPDRCPECGATGSVGARTEKRDATRL